MILILLKFLFLVTRLSWPLKAFAIKEHVVRDVEFTSKV